LVLQKALMGFLWFIGQAVLGCIATHGLKPVAIDNRSSKMDYMEALSKSGLF
jgi:hypothetical protein